jgi:hypothetical protein
VKKRKNKKAKKRTTISLSADLLAAGFARARVERRNFSNYVETLVDKDVAAVREAQSR